LNNNSLHILFQNPDSIANVPVKDTANTVVVKRHDSTKTSEKVIKKEEVKETKKEITQEEVVVKTDSIVKQESFSSYRPKKVPSEFYNIESQSNFLFELTPYLSDSVKKELLATNDSVKVTQAIKYPTRIEKMKQLDNHILKADWIFVVIIFSLAILSWFKVYNRKILKDHFVGVFSLHKSLSSISAESSAQRMSFMLYAIFVLNFSLFIYLILDFYKIHIAFNNVSLSFLALCVIILIVYGIKTTFYKIIGSVFYQYEAINEFTQSISFSNKVLGIALFPIVISLIYLNEKANEFLIYTGVVLFLIFFIIRIIRGIQICLKINLSILYFLLYLCILEILPFLLFYKVVNELILGSL
jgi:hypothetical protein